MCRRFSPKSAGDFGVSNAVLEVHGLVKAFGGVRAVDDVSFVVRTGSITGLIGPNGAGKSTLFNTIAGTLAADGGEIRLEGRAIQRAAPYVVFRLGLARAFQIPRPFASISVLENLMAVPIGQI